MIGTKDSKIIAFLHCRHCVEADRKTQFEIGLTDQYTLRVWCQRCSGLIHDFTLAEPVEPRCDVCGEINGDHKHKH